MHAIHLLVPTQGSHDVGSLNKSTSMKEYSTASYGGLQGGSVFKIDNILFGMEICLDHANKRLINGQKKGDPKIQIQLIPSAGMSIVD
jgi:hypothetical protein